MENKAGEMILVIQCVWKKREEYIKHVEGGCANLGENKRP